VRKILGPILLGLGGFLLVIGLMCLVWAPGQVKETPVDVDSVTNLEGTVSKLNLETGELEENPVKVQSITKSDSEASDDDVAVFVNTSCVVIDVDDAPDCVDGDDARLVSASTDVFATDRKSAVAVNDETYVGADAEPHEGLVNKWPFDAEKRDYEYWDGLTATAHPAVYDRTEEIEGIEAYVYKVDIKDAVVEIADGVPGTYDNAIEIAVDPMTGSFLRQSQDQQRYLASGDPVLDLKVAYTEDEVKESASEAADNRGRLTLITATVPIVAISAAAILILAAILLILGDRRTNGARRDV
jgi:hypothetical protein